ncbi:hypothetical protein NQ317_014766 [Molorchus minor]|uniref:Uncharacterized protein n=1 Tax=Molorchus minor TaxID=1323400 RepID=A0ABQ9JA12_9CUCU|nr:hypothetical protein NQ317_014766 [Molorchus minor]
MVRTLFLQDYGRPSPYSLVNDCQYVRLKAIQRAVMLVIRERDEQKSELMFNNVSLGWETSWAGRSLREMLDFKGHNARFQQRQMQEKEEKLLKLYENQQQRAFKKVSLGSAGSNTSSNSTRSGGSLGGGKVRQMFDERRQKAGVDRSYPLEPLKTKMRSTGSTERNNSTITSKTVARSRVESSATSIINDKPLMNKREVVHSIYNNNNGDESYQEHILYEDANIDLFNSNSHRNIIDMMNDHNLHDTLDDEEMPQIGFDEVDRVYIKDSRNGVNSRSPKQNDLKKPIEPVRKSHGVSPAPRNRLRYLQPTPKISVRTSPSIGAASSPARSVKASSPMSRVTKTGGSATQANKVVGSPNCLFRQSNELSINCHRLRTVGKQRILLVM